MFKVIIDNDSMFMESEVLDSKQKVSQAVSTILAHHEIELSEFRVKRLSDGKLFRLTPKK